MLLVLQSNRQPATNGKLSRFAYRNYVTLKYTLIFQEVKLFQCFSFFSASAHGLNIGIIGFIWCSPFVFVQSVVLTPRTRAVWSTCLVKPSALVIRLSVFLAVFDCFVQTHSAPEIALATAATSLIRP